MNPQDVASQPLEYVTCPGCGRQVSLLKGGNRLRSHQVRRASSGEQFPPKCPVRWINPP